MNTQSIITAVVVGAIIFGCVLLGRYVDPFIGWGLAVACAGGLVAWALGEGHIKP